jgi:uracil-DNA glycosylase family 4
MSPRIFRLNQDMTRFLKGVFGDWLPLVYGAGRAGADIMIAGDVPRREDVLEQRPFYSCLPQIQSLVGRLGLGPGDTYQTLVVKFPVTGQPDFEQMTLSLPWFVREVEAVGPRVVIALGRAGQWLSAHKSRDRQMDAHPEKVALHGVVFHLFRLPYPSRIRKDALEAYDRQLGRISAFLGGKGTS